MKINIKIHGRNRTVDSQFIYERIFESENLHDDHLKEFLSYELSPFPTSLFNNSGMRKTKKSELYKDMKTVDYTKKEKNVIYIIDGIFLLYQVILESNNTNADIYDRYLQYISDHFKSNVVVVLDGYSDNSRNIKAMKQMERDDFLPTFTESKRFYNQRKKNDTFIKRLIKILNDNDITTKIARDDADVLIVQTAIDESTKKTAVIVGNDIDLLVILIGRSREYKKEIFLKKYGRGDKETKIYSNKSFSNSPEFILFIHAFTGCDTTSAVYRKGKFGLIKLLKEKPDLSKYVEPFIKSETSKDTLFDSGIHIFLAIYDAQQSEICIDNWRYKKFLEAKNAKEQVNLSMLPPTSEAARQHIYRVYYQIQTWLGKNLNPVKWGWVSRETILIPTTTTKEAFPKELINKLFCNCKTGCTTSNCGCIKAKLLCSNLCGICKGVNCKNCGQEASGGSSGGTTGEKQEEDEDVNIYKKICEFINKY